MDALDLVRTTAQGRRAWIALSGSVLGDRRKRTALARRILSGASTEHRELYRRFFGERYDNADGWALLVDIAGRSAA
jgi:hypothetical protein